MFKVYDWWQSPVVKRGCRNLAPIVTFGDNSKGLTQGYGSLQAGCDVIIDNVSVVQGFQHNILSISQFSDKGYGVLFDKERCQILHKKNCLPLH